MSGDVHVRFRERLGGRFPGATRRNILVRSKRAGERVMGSVTRYVSDTLRLTVNPLKSAVDLSRLGVSVVETQLSNHQCITFYSIHHAMLICNTA